MHRKLSSHFRSNVVAYLALFVALGGTTAYAADTVFSEDIVDGEVKTADIGASQVQSTDIGGSQVLSADIASSAVTSSDLAANSVSQSKILDSTVKAPEIGVNAVGASEFTDVKVKSSPEFSVNDNSSVFNSVNCDTGQQTIGGGAGRTEGESIYMEISRPQTNSLGTIIGWGAQFTNRPNTVEGSQAKATVYVLCLQPGT